MIAELAGSLHGRADERLGGIVERLEGDLAADAERSFQICAYVDGRLVLDAWGGAHLGEDSLMVPFSVSKNTIGLSVALLIQRGVLDPDAPVAEAWPEFASAGKAAVTARQLLSHQAGLPDTWPLLTAAELLDHHAAAERLAAARPLWHPGSAFGYHALTIGNLADEYVFRLTGRTLHEFWERELRGPVGADFFLGLPAGQAGRLAPVLPMLPPADPDPAPAFNALRDQVFGPRPGEQIDLAGDERSWSFGHPAASSTASAKGVATMLAAGVTGVDGAAPILDAETVAVVGQQQVRGRDEVLGLDDRAHGIVFQKPGASLAWGGPRSFGHDGAMGAVACVDPDSGVAFAFTVARGAWPGGGDQRAIAVARELGTLGL